MNKLYAGVAINDSETPVAWREAGKQKLCPYYSVWVSMIKRCYTESYIRKFPTYINTIVCDDWLVFSTFREWMRKQDWRGKVLDKDLIVDGNKIYSPEMCCFIPQQLNQFFRKYKSTEDAGLPVGVKKHGYKFVASVNIKGKKEYLGLYDNLIDAERAVNGAKDSLIKEFALLELGVVRASLLNRIGYEVIN